MEIDIAQLKKSRLYSEELGIDLRKSSDRELFKWFLASILFGARISETIAKNTYRALEKHRLLGPKEILKAGWDYLVNPVMREGGYVRYDGKTSTHLLKDCQTLLDQYGGSLKKLHSESKDSEDLGERLTSFYGIGPVTANIFLRELRPFWQKSDPEPLPIVKEIAKKHRIPLNRFNRKSLTFARIEAGLIRSRKAGGEKLSVS